MYDYGYYGYDYGYDAGAAVGTGLAAFGIGMLIMWLISMAISVFVIISYWKVFKKAGKPGWAAIIPIYNTIVMIEIAELPMWYIALFFVPFANIYAIFKINIEIAKKFGKDAGFGVGMTLLAPVFYAILAFSKNIAYVGAQSVAQPMYQQPVQPQPMYQQPVQPQPMYQQPVQPAMPTPVVAPVMPTPEVAPVMPAPEVAPVMPTPEVAPVMPTPEVAPVEPQSMTPAFCTNCGSPLAPNTKFCTNCGKQL